MDNLENNSTSSLRADFFTHGVIPDRAILRLWESSSPGIDEVHLMGPCNDGEVQWKDDVGLDVSLKLTAICVVDQTGSVTREGVVDLDPRRLPTS